MGQVWLGAYVGMYCSELKFVQNVGIESEVQVKVEVKETEENYAIDHLTLKWPFNFC